MVYETFKILLASSSGSLPKKLQIEKSRNQQKDLDAEDILITVQGQMRSNFWEPDLPAHSALVIAR